MEMGHILAQLRENRNLSQAQLANELNVSAGAIGLWEVNKRFPSPETLIKIADYFNISMDILFQEDRQNKTYKKFNSEQLPQNCEYLIEYYKKMNEESRDILIGKAAEILREQRQEENGIQEAIQKRA